MELTGPWKTITRARQLRQRMSLPERLLWNALKNKQTGMRFRRQQPAGPYILDFYCHSVKLCVEVDGESHNFQAGYDGRRDGWLRSQEVRTLRISAKDVLENLDGVVQYIISEAQAPSDGLRPPPPPRGEG